MEVLFHFFNFSLNQLKIFKYFFKATNKIYICVVSRPDHLVNKATGKFDSEEYEAHPDRKLQI